jgi:hypothetical protein
VTRTDDIELILLRCIIERKQTCQQAAMEIDAYLCEPRGGDLPLPEIIVGGKAVRNPWLLKWWRGECRRCGATFSRVKVCTECGIVRTSVK